MISTLIAFIFGFSAFADTTTGTPTLVSISGYSNYTIDTTTTPPTIKIYAGYIDDGSTPACTGTTTSSTCNSCTGTGLVPCNKNMVYPNLKFHLEVQSSISMSGEFPKIQNGAGSIIQSPTTGYSGNNYWIDDTWTNICAAGGWTACQPTSASPLLLTFGVGKNASDTTFDEKILVQIYFSYRNSTTTTDVNYTDCTSATGTANQGFCSFTLARGDAKAYVDTILTPSTFPSSSATSVDFTNVVFFYNPRGSDSTDDQTVMSGITNASSSAEITVDKNKTPPISDNRIKGLTNLQYYCFVMASKDLAGNIYNYTPTTSFPSAGVQNSTMCVKPAPVVGLLDDKKCFIATAAFGSELDPHVEIFRQFRNKILYSNKIGTKLVELYYEKSPQYAAMIRESETLRFFARTFLWPLLLFAQASLAIGFWPTLMTLFTLFTIGVLVIRRRTENKVENNL